MRVVKSLVVAVALAAVSASAHASTYVAYDQFAISSGAITATDFAYGGTTGAFTGSITPFESFQAACSGDASVQCARTGDLSVSKGGTYDPAGTSFFLDGFLNLHPGENNISSSVVQFIAPTAGLYSFAGLFKAHDVSPTGVNLSAYVGAASQFSQYMGGGSYAFAFDALLDADERVSFLVGPSGDYRYDSTGLKLTVTGYDSPVSGVPEPATWAMMIAGFGLVGGAMRRRRDALAA